MDHGGDAMVELLHAKLPLCDLSVIVHSIKLRKASARSRQTYYQHKHPGFEIHCITAGSCQVMCNSETFSLEPGTILLLPPGMYHNSTDIEKETVHISMCFSLEKPDSAKPGSKAYTFAQVFDHSAPVLVQLQNTEAQQILHKLESLLSGSYDDAYRSDKLFTLFSGFLLELPELIGAGKTNPTSSVVTDCSQDAAYMIDSFLGVNFMHNNAMPRIADQLHVSTRQLHRTIKKHYGTNYRNLLTETRLKIAVNMLSNTDMPIHEIAESLGYSSSANFSAFIKRCTGKTPSQLRKSGKDK